MQDKQQLSHYVDELVLQVNNKVEMDEEDTKEKKVLENTVSQNNHNSYNLRRENHQKQDSGGTHGADFHAKSFRFFPFHRFDF